METTEAPDLLTIREVAKQLRVTPSSIDRWVAEGAFPAPIKLGGAIKRFRREDVEAHIAASQSAEPFAARDPRPKRSLRARK